MSYILDALKKSEQERGHGNIPGVQTIHSASVSYRTERRAIWPYVLIIAVLLNVGVIVYFNIDRSGTTTTAVSVERSPAARITDRPVTEPAPGQTQQMPPASADSTVDAEPEDNRAMPTVSPSIASTSTHDENAIDNSSIDRTASDDATTVNTEEKKQYSDASGTQGWEMITPGSTAYQQEQSTASAPAMEKTNTPVHSQPATASEQTYTASTNSSYSPTIIDYNELPEATRKQLPAIIISAHVYSSNPSQRSIVINNDFMEEGEYLIDDLILYEITREGAVFNYHGTLFHYGRISSWQ